MEAENGTTSQGDHQQQASTDPIPVNLTGAGKTQTEDGGKKVAIHGGLPWFLGKQPRELHLARYSLAPMFTAADFELYQGRFQADPEWNGRRLDIRRRLQALGEEVKSSYGALGVDLERRESLHHPHATNRKRVRRQRTMLFRGKKLRKQLKSFLGRELGKDLDSAVNNLHLQIGLDESGAYWGLRLDSGAWYDLNVLLKRAEQEPGRKALAESCGKAPDFRFVVDGKGGRPFEQMNSRDWRDLAGILRPGESRLEIVQRMTPDQVVAAGEDFGPGVVADLERLADFYQLACWNLDSPSGASL
ncbi:MAG: hypothetical protein DWQ01_09335 [Planctomycetota bacterium]|nr:MAG: hypothetical protein DWQ01_09335 [Planctomycetota bacterium]